MAHMLDFTKGFAAIAYRGETPWHGYGAEMQPNEPLEAWYERAGLAYSVDRRPVFTVGKDGTQVQVPKMRALVRSDNDATLSVVSDRYKVVQPKEVLEFFRDLIEDQGFELETAGALADGKRVWALARTGESFTLPNVPDQVSAYLLLATSYDKQFATTAQFTSVRVVCNNTLSFSISEGERSDGKHVFRVPHTSDFDSTLIKGSLGLLGPSWQQFEEDVRKLSSVPISKRQVIEFYMELMGYDEEADDPQNAYVVKKLLQSYEYGPGQELKSAKDTLWGVIGGVTYFTDHVRRAHNNGTRINSAWFGESAQLKQKAWDRVHDIAANYYKEAA